MQRVEGPVVPILPEPARRHLTELAATVLGELTDAEVPAGLRRVRAFAPARRARSGAGPLAVALERDAPFRHRVAAAWRARHPELSTALDGGQVPPTTDPFLALAGVQLLRPPGWENLVAGLHDVVADRQEERARTQEEVTAKDEARAARAEVERLAVRLREQGEQLTALAEENAGLRRELRRHRAEADRARAAAREAAAQAGLDREAAVQAQEVLRVAQDEAAARVREAQERADQARRAAKDGRSLGEARVRLLLDTVVEAASGLRRELALPPLDVRPADLVAGVASASQGSAAVPARGQPGDDPGLLTELLAMPQVHLVVDGYNVTKTGYGTLPLVEQRRRLVEALAVLAHRTSSEVTCCFDGAAVEAPGALRVRGVRVLFSPAGTTADDLILRLVRAEPPGRPVVVVSGDGEVIAGARSAGAYAVPSAALLRLLSRA